LWLCWSVNKSGSQNRSAIRLITVRFGMGSKEFSQAMWGGYMRKMLLLLGCLPAIVGCPAAPVAVGVVAGLGGGYTLGQVTAVIVAGTVVLQFVEKAYDVDRARLRRDKAQLEVDMFKDGSRKTEIIQLTFEQAAAIEDKGYYLMKKPDGSEQQVPVKLD
jgi:hypothetical protein